MLHRIIPRRIPRGSAGPAARKPEWYLRVLKRRPPGICKRGPYRPRKPLVEDAVRVKAEQLWQAAARPAFVNGREMRVPEHLRPSPDGRTRYFIFGADRLSVSLGKPFPFRRPDGRGVCQVFVHCPSCRRRCRLIYRVGESLRCWRCAGLAYRSDAERRQRWRERIDAAKAARAAGRRVDFDKAAPQWFRTQLGFVRARMAERREMAERRYSGSCVRDSRREQREAEREAQRVRRHEWRQFIEGLPTRAMKDRARMARKCAKSLASGRSSMPDVLEGILREQLAMLPDMPPGTRAELEKHLERR